MGPRPRYAAALPIISVFFGSNYFVNGGTVAWPNGADVAPETLYAHRGLAEEAA